MRTPVLFLLILALTLSCNKPGRKPQEEAKESGKTLALSSEVNDLPAVTLIEESGKQFSAKTLPGNSILVFFGATCDHCQRQAQDFQKHLKSLSNYKIYFIAMDAFPALHQFAKDYKIDNQPNVLFLRADGNTVNNTLGYIQTPTIFTYDSSRKLLKRFDGETALDKILSALPEVVR